MSVLLADQRPASSRADQESRWEVADVFRKGAAAYRRSHVLTPVQHKVVRAILSCRTSELGGHVHYCERCDFERISYNSCRNRHCPKCQFLAQERWLEDRRRDLLPVSYFHLVFTLPHQLNPLVLWNKKIMFDTLFKVVSDTLKEFGRNNLGGKIGFTLILHSWDQQLRPHFHLHCVIAGGALAPDQSNWTASSPEFLFPVRALSKVYRGKFVAAIGALLSRDDLELPEGLGHLHTSDGRARFFRDLCQRDWIVYAKKPFAGPGQVLRYLSRYTHRIAISNRRIEDVTDTDVTFGYRDRKRDQKRSTTVTHDEFIRRFLLHVVDKGFVRIRHYGFLASATKARDLATCRALLGAKITEPEPARTVEELFFHATGIDLHACPRCGAELLTRDLPREPRSIDSS